MRVALIGYGKMGKAIEEILLQSGDEVVLRLSAENHHALTADNLQKADVAIEFTAPEAAVENILLCLRAGVPVVSGSTGWYAQLPDVTTACQNAQGALLYSPNFSIGVNLFFALTRQLGKLMKTHPEYIPSLEEIHHTEKKDAPSGTAIRAAEVLLAELEQYKNWALNENTAGNSLGIRAIREYGVPGTHRLTFRSAVDQIELSHEAFSRKGFAEGAITAARFLVNKKGVFTMQDVLNLSF